MGGWAGIPRRRIARAHGRTPSEFGPGCGLERGPRAQAGARGLGPGCGLERAACALERGLRARAGGLRARAGDLRARVRGLRARAGGLRGWGAARGGTRCGIRCGVRASGSGRQTRGSWAGFAWSGVARICGFSGKAGACGWHAGMSVPGANVRLRPEIGRGILLSRAGTPAVRSKR